MADKYLIHGATYCGDGTASNEAASAGAAGAWNDINVFEGSAPAYGSLAAGDVVHIRSKDSSGANITRQTSSGDIYLGSSNATEASWIQWIIDGGTVWSGISGTITYEVTSASYRIRTRDANHYQADVQDALTLKTTGTSSGGALADLSGIVKNVKLDASSAKGNYTYEYAGIIIVRGVLENPHILPQANTTCSACVLFPAYTDALVINPDVEISATNNIAIFSGIGETYSYSAFGTVIGGAVRGAISAGTYLCDLPQQNMNQFNFKTIGLQVPSTMPLVRYHNNGSTLESVGMDNKHGAVYQTYRGLITSRSENSPPVLDAVLPDAAATPWSWLLKPTNAIMREPLSKTLILAYEGDEDIVDVTLEFLVTQGYALNKRNCWADVFYVDASTNAKKLVSSRDMAGGSLTTSTASWSTDTWAGIQFDKKKITVQTPTAVKQGSQIVVSLHVAYKSQTTSDVLFLDPAIKAEVAA